MSGINPNNPPPQGFGIALFQWMVANILWLKRRINAISGSGGGGGGSVTLTEHQVAYGSPTNEVTSSSDFIYDTDAGILDIGFAGDTFLTVSSALAALGDLSGTGNGLRIGVINIPANDYAVAAGDNSSNRYFFILPSAGFYYLGDIDNTANGTSLLIDDSKASVVAVSSTNAMLSLDGINGLYQVGDVSDASNSTKLVIDDTIQTVQITNVPTYTNDADAISDGLTAGMLYKTTTLGITSLNIVP